MSHKNGPTDPYGLLEYAVGTGDDFICFDYHIRYRSDRTPGTVLLHAVLNSETGHFIEDFQKCVVPAQDAVEALASMVDDALEWADGWGVDDPLRLDLKGWNQDPYWVVRMLKWQLATKGKRGRLPARRRRDWRRNSY